MSAIITLAMASVGSICPRLAWQGIPHSDIAGKTIGGAALGGIVGLVLSVIVGSLLANDFRFNIRDVVWVSIVVAMATQWFLDHSVLVKKAERSEAERAKNYYCIWEVGRLWARDTRQEVEFPDPEGNPVRAYPDGGVRVGKYLKEIPIAKWISLGELFQAANQLPPESSIFLPNKGPWELDTRCCVLHPRNELSYISKAHFHPAMTIKEIRRVVDNANMQHLEPSPEMLKEAFFYFYDTHEFLPFELLSNDGQKTP
ncbi:MAG: hypothetical protein QM778_00115 [Myxococcales bacterium]